MQRSTLFLEPLQNREDQGLVRVLKVFENLSDFCSNDYLGFAKNAELKELIQREICTVGPPLNGATGSRLISGNTKQVEQLEEYLAMYHGVEAALILNSGYDANLGLVSCVASRGDTILYDELSHASIRDGVRLSYARAHHFRHNDLADLRKKMKLARGRVFIIVESIYSMDGDAAPLSELATLCKDCGAYLIVDEAHSTGLFGAKGAGIVQELGLEKIVLARVHTFGKALGCHGAAIVGSELLKRYLINFCRPLIYSTALPAHSIAAIKCAYLLLEKCEKERMRALENARILRELLLVRFESTLIPGFGAIVSLLVPGAAKARDLARRLQSQGYGVNAILAPTVPAGKERIRICVHAFNTEDEITGLVKAIESGQAGV